VRIDRSDAALTCVSDLKPGDVFQVDSSFHIVTNIADARPGSWMCVNLETGISSRFASDGGPVRYLPDATLVPHGLKSSES